MTPRTDSETASDLHAISQRFNVPTLQIICDMDISEELKWQWIELFAAQ